MPLGTGAPGLPGPHNAAWLDTYLRRRGDYEFSTDYNKSLLKSGMSVVGNATNVKVNDELGGQLVLQQGEEQAMNVIALNRSGGGANVHASIIGRKEAEKLIEKLREEK